MYVWSGKILEWRCVCSSCTQMRAERAIEAPRSHRDPVRKRRLRKPPKPMKGEPWARDASGPARSRSRAG